jgi:hypothetical protein
LKKLVKNNSTKPKLNILEILGQALDIVGKPLMGLHRGDFIIFRNRVGEISNFEYFLAL